MVGPLNDSEPPNSGQKLNANLCVGVLRFIRYRSVGITRELVLVCVAQVPDTPIPGIIL